MLETDKTDSVWSGCSDGGTLRRHAPRKSSGVALFN